MVLDIVAAQEHEAGKDAHYGFGLKVEVAHHDIAWPPTKEVDDVGVNLCSQECHDTQHACCMVRYWFAVRLRVGPGMWMDVHSMSITLAAEMA